MPSPAEIFICSGSAEGEPPVYISTSSCLTVDGPGDGESWKGKGGDGLGVEGAEGSRWEGMAVGLFVFLADFGLAFVFAFDDLDEEGVFADFGCLLGVLVAVFGVFRPSASLGARPGGVEALVSRGSPRSLDGPASGVAS